MDRVIKTTGKLRLEVKAGSITGAAEDMVDIANKTGLSVCCEFNGVDLVANPGSTAAIVEDAYWQELAQDHVS